MGCTFCTSDDYEPTILDNPFSEHHRSEFIKLNINKYTAHHEGEDHVNGVVRVTKPFEHGCEESAIKFIIKQSEHQDFNDLKVGIVSHDYRDFSIPLGT